jgi:uncharacterized protein (TIGR02466 family)
MNHLTRICWRVSNWMRGSSGTTHRWHWAIRAQTTSEAAVRNVLAFIKVADAPFGITGCWVNVLGQGAAHATHSHPNNFLSGVYYLQTQAGTDTINFHDPRPQTAIVRPPVTELTPHAGTSPRQ